MAENGLPPKSPIMPIGRGAQNRKRHASSTTADSMIVHLRSTAGSQLLANKNDVDKLESNLGLLSDDGNLKSTEDPTGPPSASDYNSSPSERGATVTTCSSINEFVENKKRPCKISQRSDSNTDPKRIKRILANRLSAQRSRVKKMQYINELERTVSALQAEIEMLTPQVAYYDNQRRLLSAENSVIKQRISALVHERLLKDAQFNTFRQDGERFNQLLTFSGAGATFSGAGARAGINSELRF